MPDRKLPMANKIVLLAVLFSSAAWGCSIASTAYCKYVDRHPTFDTGNVTLPPLLEDRFKLAFEDHGVGFWAWQLDGSCFNYCSSWGACPAFDTKFNSARAFTAVTDILGGIGTIYLWFQCCGPREGGLLKLATVFFALSTLFEGLTLLIFRSNVCTDPSFFSYMRPYYSGNPDDLPVVTSVSCSLSTGSNLAIAATVCWLFAAGLTSRVPAVPEKEEEEEQSV